MTRTKMAVAAAAGLVMLLVWPAPGAKSDDLLVTQPSFDPTYNYTIMRVDAASGEVLGTFASVPDIYSGPGFDGLVKPELGPDGNVYVPNGHGNSVLRFDGASGAFLGVFAQNPSGDGNPYSVAFMPGGDMLMRGPTGLNRFSVTGAYIGQFADGAGFAPTYGPDGSLYAARYDYSIGIGDWQSTIWRFDGSTGAALGQFGAAIRGQITDLEFSLSGELLVADDLGGRILALSGSDGAALRELVAPGAGGLSSTGTLAIGSDGVLLVADPTGQAIRRFDLATGASLGNLGAPGTWVRPYGLAFVPRAPSVVPEGGSLALLLSGVGPLALLLRRKRA